MKSVCLDKVNSCSLLGLCVFLCLGATAALAQENSGNGDSVKESLLQDFNGDGVIKIVAFGDSITRGEGDFTGPNQTVFMANSPSGEAGYPLRIESYLGLGVDNFGSSGEDLTTQGVSRFIQVVSNSRPDVVIIAEGSNDARLPATPGAYYRSIQTILNVAHAIGSRAILATIIPACRNHGFLQRFLDTYNPQVRTLALVNNVPLADADQAYRNTCNPANCRLLNLPEGLHPNIEGYDVLGEMMIAALLDINLLEPDGPMLLAQALSIDPATIKTIPNAPLTPAM